VAEEPETSTPSAESNQRLFDIINPGNIYMKTRVENSEAWCDLAYSDGMPEFTVIQLTYFGDYLVSEDQLRKILRYANRVIVDRK